MLRVFSVDHKRCILFAEDIVLIEEIIEGFNQSLKPRTMDKHF